MNTGSQKIVMILIVFLFFSLCLPVFAAESKGDELLKKAQDFESRAYYLSAYKTYSDAQKEFSKEKRPDQVEACRVKVLQMSLIWGNYPYTEDQAKKMIEAQPYGKEIFRRLLAEGKLDHMMIDGKPWYYQDFIDNAVSRNDDLMQLKFNANEQGKGAEGVIFQRMQDRILQDATIGCNTACWDPYNNPVKYLVTMSVKVPRNKLPQQGTLRLWMPSPVQSDSQRDVEFVSVTPSEFCTVVPRVNEDIGVTYFEIPLEKVKDDLNVTVKYTFTHYEQFFRIDPANAGVYNKESDLYKRYTQSEGNTVITPDIEKTAREIVGTETNPYLCAKKINDYVVDNIRYSFMPHTALGVLNIPESVYVHEHKYGDCGAQAVYTAALMRSIGIPARSAGGMFALPGRASDHFWGEFYLPNYGWVPYDTSVTQGLSQAFGTTDEKRQKVRDYFFGHQDPYRFLIQNSVDLPLYPMKKEPRLLNFAFQLPDVECDAMDVIPVEQILENFKVDVEAFDF